MQSSLIATCQYNQCHCMFSNAVELNSKDLLEAGRTKFVFVVYLLNVRVVVCRWSHQPPLAV